VCTKDENRGYYCKKVAPGAGGLPLNECLKQGLAGNACSCNHEQGYALNNQNNACSTFACTDDGKNGWGSAQTDPSKNKDKYMVPVVNTKIGTCYALDNEGLLLNPNDDSDKSKVCTNKTTQESCNDMNQEGWKCKWLPQVTCKRKNYKFCVDTLNKCKGKCNSLSKWNDSWDKDNCPKFQYKCFRSGRGGVLPLCGVRDVYTPPPINSDKDMPFNPAEYQELTKRLHPFPDNNNDLSLYALILALLIVAILVFTIRQM
jgi:hypothetical protein